MDKELIERLARESGMKREQWLTSPPRFAGLWTEESGIERFAALVAEECAKVADGLRDQSYKWTGEYEAGRDPVADSAASVASAIRAKFSPHRG